MILLHGRNAGPENIMELAAALEYPGFTYLAPAAAGRTWYPKSFLAPTHENEPFLSSALEAVTGLIPALEAAGIPGRRVVLAGFSQGACLALETAVRWLGSRKGRLGGVIGFSGGLIGPAGTRWDQGGEAEGLPVLLGCSDVDAHIPRERVEETARVFERLGAQVTLRIYPGMGHLVNQDELRLARELVGQVAG